MSAGTAQFRHEALLYDGADELVARTLPFIREGLALGEPLLVALEPPKIARLTAALGADADRVQFVDMIALGRNPARIIPAWQDFVDRHTADGGRVRGIGEPVWPGRSPLEVQECRCHEALLNVAFAGREDFLLLCPYDAGALDEDALHAAHATHGLVRRDGRAHESATFEPVVDPFVAPLAERPATVASLRFERSTVHAVRAFVAGHAAAVRLDAERVDSLVLAVSEVATNSVLHGGGTGELHAWSDGGALVCEIRDRGRIADPLTGRRRPGPDQIGGHGLWIANQLCDLVQIRSGPDGSVVRLHLAPAPA